MTATPDDIASFIGARIKKRREYLGRNQSETAAVIGNKAASMSRIEAGEIRISAVDLVRVAEYLRAPIEYFTGDIDQSALDSAEVSALLKALPPDLYHLAIEQLRVLANFASRQKET